MNFKYDNEIKLTEVEAEEDDICLFCTLFND